MEKATLIYNETMLIAHHIEPAWLSWIRDDYIRPIINTSCFTNATLLRLLHTDQTHGMSYAIQFFAKSTADVEYYQNIFAPVFHKNLAEKWGEDCLPFHTILEIVH